jgi:putative ABC transport system permease protein
VSRGAPLWTVLLFETTLLAYPRAFRRRFGAPMRDTFLRQDAAAARAGWGARLRFVVGTTVHTIGSGLAERVAAFVRLVWWPNHRPHLYAPEGRHAMFWDTLRADVRHTLRLAVKAPLFTLLTVLALALGIGANSAIFAVINGVLLQPLPYADADRLVMVWSDARKEGRQQNPLSPANYRDFQQSNQTLDGLAAYFSFVTPLQIVGDEGVTEVAYGMNVAPGVFEVLGRRPALGRVFRTDDATTGVVLSHGHWQRRYGSDPTVVGKPIQVYGLPATILGVMPPDFVFPYAGMLGPSGFTRVQNVDMWVPLVFDGPLAAVQRTRDAQGQFPRNVHWLGAIGRMKADVGVEQVRADMSAIAAQLEQSYPATNQDWGATVVPAHEQTIGAIRPALLVLLGCVGLVLLMAAVNVANLVLARSLARQTEQATRVALGASSARMVQQSLTESLVLALTGGLLGLLLTRLGVQLLVALAPTNLPRLNEVSIDLRVVAVTFAISVLSGVIVGVLPALSAARTSPQGALREQGRGNTGNATRRRLRGALIVAEVALAVLVTASAGLLLRSFVSLLNVDPGFRPDRLLTWQMNIPQRLTTPDQRRAFYLDFFARLQALPGVTAIGGTTRLPLGSTSVTTTVDIEGRPRPPADLPEVEFRRNLHDYFEAMGIPVLRGRNFTASDLPTAPPVVVINETMAKRLFPGEDPVGQRMRTGPGPNSAWMEIVGVIGDVRHTGLEREPAPELYVHYLQNPPVNPFIVIRTTGDPAALAETVRAEARTIDKDLPVYDMRTMMDVRAASVAERRFILLLVGAFGVLALVLAAVGVYGVMSVVVTERTQEMGVRLALGARASQVVGLVLGQAARLALLGVVIGVAAAMVLAPLLASQLYGVQPIDPWTFAGVPLVLLALAAVAALVPALRAMRLDPVTALRHS